MDFSLLTFGELLHPLNGDLKNQIRNFEKQKKQILSAKYGILFNQTCLNEELHPTYRNIYIYTQGPPYLWQHEFKEKLHMCSLGHICP